MNWIKRILGIGGSKKKSGKSVSDDMMGAIMAIGEKGNLEDFPIMKKAILSEGDKGISFAALKRIHKFKSADGFEDFFGYT